MPTNKQTQKRKNTPWLSEEAVTISRKRRGAKARRDQSLARKPNGEFQRQARTDNEMFLSTKCDEMDIDYHCGKTRDCFTKIKQITGKFKPRMGVVLNKDKTPYKDGGKNTQRNYVAETQT